MMFNARTSSAPFDRGKKKSVGGGGGGGTVSPTHKGFRQDAFDIKVFGGESCRISSTFKKGILSVLKKPCLLTIGFQTRRI